MAPKAALDRPRGQKRKLEPPSAASMGTTTNTNTTTTTTTGIGTSTGTGTGMGMNASSSPRKSAFAQRAATKRPKFLEARQIVTQDVRDALKDQQLDLEAFVGARDFEIRALESSMHRTRTACKANTFQKVPRALRRRTASHNPKRVPKRLRAQGTRRFVESNTPLVVSRRRKPRTTKARIRAETAKRLAVLAAKKRRRQTRAREEKEKENETDKSVSGSGSGNSGATSSEGVTITTRVARPKIRRNALNDPLPVKSRFRKRQVDKTWLPTHVWHAKRARMTEPKSPLWRFAIPLTPNEKTYRPTHRAQGDSGAVVWDVSYVSTIGLCGRVAGIERVLRAVGVRDEACWNDRGRRWKLGTRAWTGLLSRQDGDHRRPVCPASITWNPEKKMDTEVGAEGKEQEAEEGESERTGRDVLLDSERQRQRLVILRAHPSAFLELFNELLRLTRMEKPRLYVEDLRFEIGSIELTGPASTECLLGILRPFFGTGPDGRPDLAAQRNEERQQHEHHARMFSSLKGLTNAASLPSGAVLGFSIQDPRLRYPPRTVEPPEADGVDSLLELMVSWPAEESLSPFSLWDRNCRFEASKLPSQKSVDRRKGAKMPGTHLEPTAADPPIPIVLVSTRSGSMSATVGKAPTQTQAQARAQAQAQGTWTLLAPWKCIQPIWYCLMRYPLSSGGNPRLGGLEEIRQVSFERGVPWFPADFLGTDAGAAWELAERQKRQAAWDRRPKSKRVEWDSVDLGAGRKGEIGDGLHCDFEYLFLDGVQDQTETAALERTSFDLERLTHLSRSQFAELARYQAGTSGVPVAGAIPPRAIIQVRLVLVGRGVATTCARVYRLPCRPRPRPPPRTTEVMGAPRGSSSSSEVEVPATDPPLPAAATAIAIATATKPNIRNRAPTHNTLPADLRDQWLSQVPGEGTKRGAGQARRITIPPNADLATRKKLIAQSLLAGPKANITYPPPPPNQADVGGHPLVPGEDHLIGFVTTGSFCLTHGKGSAIASIAAGKVLEDLQSLPSREARLCIVRNAGENVGRLARWEVV